MYFSTFLCVGEQKFVISVAQMRDGKWGWVREGWEWTFFLCFVKFALDEKDVNE